MTDAADLGCGAYVVGRWGERWAVYWYGCRSERNGVECGQKEVSKCVLLVAVREGGGDELRRNLSV